LLGGTQKKWLKKPKLCTHVLPYDSYVLGKHTPVQGVLTFTQAWVEMWLNVHTSNETNYAL